MTAREALYHQEVLILAYTYLHPEELKELENNDFSFVATKQMFMIMAANYNRNNQEFVNGHEIIDAMAKNKRFNNLLSHDDLILRVLSCHEDYIVGKAIFDGWIRYIREKRDKL